MSNGKIKPISPGEILFHDFIFPLSMKQSQFARHIGIPISQIYSIVSSKKKINAEIALRLAKSLQTTPEFWLNLQKNFDLNKYYNNTKLMNKLEKIAPYN